MFINVARLLFAPTIFDRMEAPDDLYGGAEDEELKSNVSACSSLNVQLTQNAANHGPAHILLHRASLAAITTQFCSADCWPAHACADGDR